MSIHHQTHPTAVEGCIVCRALTVSVNRSAMTKSTDLRERQLGKDLDAYKRLRSDGLHPKGIDGSADLEGKVNSQWDIDLGRYVPKGEESRIQEGMGIAKEMGFAS